MGGAQSSIRCNFEQRLNFIEFRLFLEAHVNRITISNQCSFHSNKKEDNINKCIDIASSIVFYDKINQFYARKSGCKPKYRAHHTDRNLAEVKSIKKKILDREGCLTANLPPLAPELIPLQSLNSLTLRTEVFEIRKPDAIEFNELRWHPQAFWLIGKMSKSISLNKMLEINKCQKSDISAKKDNSWKAEFTLEIALPTLCKAQAKDILPKHGMHSGGSKNKFQNTLLYSAVGQTRLNTDPGARKPQDQQIILLNREFIHEDHG